MDIIKIVEREKKDKKKRQEAVIWLQSLGFSDQEIEEACDKVYGNKAIMYWPDACVVGGELKVNNKSPENFRAFCKYQQISFGPMLTNTLININGRTKKLDDDSLKKLTTLIWEAGWRVPEGEVSTYITSAIYEQDEYGFFRSFAESKPWDKQDRIRALFDCLPVREDGFKEVHFQQFKKWVHGLVAKATNTLHPDGVFNYPKHDTTLILQGKEGGKKSAYWRSLLPKVSIPIFKEGSVDPKNKDHKIATSRYLIWNISEIDETLKKRDASALKAFLTNRYVTDRIPYARKEADNVSNCVFCGDTNESRFLVPGHENRRFHVIPIDDLPINIKHQIDIQQVWAQCLEERRNGFANWNDDNEELIRSESQKPFIKVDSIARWLETAVESKTAGELEWKDAMSLGDVWTYYNRFCKLHNLYPSDQSTLENRLLKEIHHERQYPTSRSSKTERFWLVDIEPESGSDDELVSL